MENFTEKDVKFSVIELLSGEAILLSVDKLRLGLIDVVSLLEKKNAYKVSLGLFFSSLTALVTSDFKDVILMKDVWKSIFIIVCIGSAFHFIFNIIQFAIIRIKNEDTIDSLISYFNTTEKKNLNNEYNKSSKTEKEINSSSIVGYEVSNYDFNIRLPKGATQTQLMELNRLLKLNPDGKKGVIILPSGKKIPLPYGVRMNNELDKQINLVLNS